MMCADLELAAQLNDFDDPNAAVRILYTDPDTPKTVADNSYSDAAHGGAGASRGVLRVHVFCR